MIHRVWYLHSYLVHGPTPHVQSTFLKKSFFLSDAPTRGERNEGVGPLHLLLSTLSPLLIVLLLLGQLFLNLFIFII